MPIDLLTFVIPAPRGRRRSLLHLLRQVDGAGEPRHSDSGTPATQTDALIRHLSRREMQILELLAEGLRTEEIAARLAICPATVNNHVENILGKLHLHRRLDAVLALLRQRP